MYVEVPRTKNGVTISDIRGYYTIEELKRRVEGVNWRTMKIYKVFFDTEPRRLVKKELLELGAVEID